MHFAKDFADQGKFHLLFEQENQIWPKLVVSKVATQCTDIKFTSTTCNICEMTKNRVIIVL